MKVYDCGARNVGFTLRRSAGVAWLSLASVVMAPSVMAVEPSLVIAREGQTAYQVVLPDAPPAGQIEIGLAEIGRLFQAAFAANQIEIAVVKESDRDLQRPGIYLGATAFAREAGIDLDALNGYDYLHQVLGQDVVIAGNDQPSRVSADRRTHVSPVDLDRIATAKAAVDFLREYVGVRFLYPDFGGTLPDGRRFDFAASPGIEFLPRPVIAVPAGLERLKRANLAYNIWRNNNSVWHLANNFLPIFNALWSAHSHENAVPVDRYYDTNPEYFALIGGNRFRGVQYCISNPEFQDRIYRYAAEAFDAGHERVYIGHSDGFRPCQCPACFALYDTGDDWTEKLWIFNRRVAERLQASHPDRTAVLTAYTVTERNAPKTFDRFPPNTMLMMCGTNERDLEKWRHIEIPQGITAYIYSWTHSYQSVYAPMMTPSAVFRQMQRLHRHNARGIYRDGSPNLYGLQGPVAYVFGRFWDDPENLTPEGLTREFIEAAFGDAVLPMMQFYNALYKGIEVYAEYLGTRLEGWGKINDSFQQMGFLYPPRLLAELDEALTRAENATGSDRVRARLALVRREFEWLRRTVEVVHFYHAHVLDAEHIALRDRLLDAIDARNVFIDSLYNERGHGTRPHPAWHTTLYPIPGHSANHLRGAYRGYRSDFHVSALNWDPAALRTAPPAHARRLGARQAPGHPPIDSVFWGELEASSRLPVGDEGALADGANIRAFFGAESLFLRFDAQISGVAPSPGDHVEVFLAPDPGENVFYRFRVGADGTRFDAATGLIEDEMHLLYGNEDPDWTGPWDVEVQIDADGQRWFALLKLPYATLGVAPPTPGSTYWRANFMRGLTGPGEAALRWLWSGATTVTDRGSLGVLEFIQLSTADNLRVMRVREGYDIPPPEWAQLPDPLPADALGAWRFRPDPIEQGLREQWQAPELDDREWAGIRVPAWYAETHVGSYNGMGWYRVRFQTPEAWEGRPLRIHFGAVDKEGWVYLNGHLLREHTVESEGRGAGELYDSPFYADATAEQVRHRDTNVLVVRVRNTFAGGGLSRPVLIRALPQ